MRLRKLVGSVVCVMMLASLGYAQMHETVDREAIFKIKEEGLRNSQVMETMSYLTDIHGPRLTGSPNIRAAGEWAAGKLTEWGMENVHQEAFPFGRGWSNQRFVAHVTSPQSYPLIGAPLAWTPGTKGPVKAEVIFAPMEGASNFRALAERGDEILNEYKEKYRGKLKEKVVLVSSLRDIEAAWKASARRFSDGELDQMAAQPMGGGRSRFAGLRGRITAFRNKVRAFYLKEGVAAVVTISGRDKGILRPSSGGPRETEKPEVPVQFMLSAEHYGRIVRTLKKKIPVTMEVDIASTFHDDDTDSFNLIAEIPGTDKAGEVVMLGAHFDSWHGGTGATDNGAGSGVMLEAIRILKATGLPMRRTVRLGLWTGEEQGLLGSRAYVKEHFGDRETMELKPGHEKFSAYFNIDNGTGKIRGVYLQGNEAAAPVFQAWMRPFENMGLTTLAIRNTGGTDHLAFDAVGLPGFQFIQDPVEYGSRTHHTNQDVYERLQEDDMKQMAVIVASFVYHAANREQRFPRKPLPEPRGNSN